MKKVVYKIANYFLNKQWILKIVMRFLSEEKQQRILIAQLRGELSFFGCDTTNMTDEEIMEGVKEVGRIFGSFGLTVKEAGKAMRILGSN